MWNFLWNFSGLDFWLPTRVAWISSSFIATCSPRAPDLVNWRCCWLLIVVIDCRSYSWSKSCSSGWWSWTISCCGLDTVWQIMFLLTAVAAPLMRVWVLSKQLVEAGLFLLCNSSLTILLISSVVFSGTDWHHAVHASTLTVHFEKIVLPIWRSLFPGPDTPAWSFPTTLRY